MRVKGTVSGDKADLIAADEDDRKREGGVELGHAELLHDLCAYPW